MGATAPQKPTIMSSSHKKALATGKAEGRIIREYLTMIDFMKPRRGRRRTPDSIRQRLATIEKDLLSAEPLQKLRLIQERLDLLSELQCFRNRAERSASEEQFVKVAKSFSTRNNISYEAWKQFGVDESVLKRAGLTRG